jgi:hypothetical protein
VPIYEGNDLVDQIILVASDTHRIDKQRTAEARPHIRQNHDHRAEQRIAQPARVLTVRVEQVSVHSGVGEDTPVSGQLLLGQTVQAVGWATGPELFTWWRLNTGGWVRGDAFLDAANISVPDACLSLPFVEQ